MFDTIGIRVSDLAKSRAFYMAALAPLGAGVVVDSSRSGWHSALRDGHGSGWVLAGRRQVVCIWRLRQRIGTAAPAFYSAALKAGGTANGAPGASAALSPTAALSPKDYGAFVLDPDGHNVEPVCRNPED